MKNRLPAQQGFTLIEVLVALTLMALVSLISWRGLDAVQQTGERLDERSEQTLALVRALGQIERDVLLHAGADVLPEPAAAGSAPGAVSGASLRLPAGIAWDPQTGLSLVRSAGDGLWQQLRWYLHEGKLVRAAGTPSYLLPLPAAEAGVVVLEQVSALGVRMWQPGQGWVEPPRTTRGGAADLAQGSRHDDAQGGVRDGGQAAARANALGQGGAAGLEIVLHRQGPAADKPYRIVVALP